MICKFLAIMNQTMSIMFCLSKDSRGYSEKLGHPIESSWYKLLERLRFTLTPNGKREFVPRDQVFPLFFVYRLLLLHKNK